MPAPIITVDEAIDTAYKTVPASVVERFSLCIWWTSQIGPYGAWQMEFIGATISQDELGWVNNPKATPSVLLDDYHQTGIYNILLINIDGQTGMIQLKMAANGPQVGVLPPPLTVIPPKAN